CSQIFTQRGVWLKSSQMSRKVARSKYCNDTIVNCSFCSAIQCVQFHPDGLILGTGTAAHRIRVWDIKTMSNVASFEGHKGKVVDISFSENGWAPRTKFTN